MARLTDEDRENILALFHTGEYSNNHIAEKYNTSHTTINKITKNLIPKHKDKVSTLVSVKSELAKESFKEIQAVETLVEEKTKHLKLINDNATKLAQKINDMTDEVCEAKDIKDLVDANDKLSITLGVNQRHANSQVNISNTNATQTNIELNKDIVLQTLKSFDDEY